MTTPKPLAYSYRRFSHIKQQEGHSLARQLDIAIKYCAENDLQLVDDAEYTFLDRAKSGWDGSNIYDDDSELRRFYELVKAKAIPEGSYLIVESLDRLSRQHPRDALPRFLDLLNANINVVSVNDGRVYRKDAHQLDLIVSIMEMARSFSESEHKSIRVSKAWKDKQESARKGMPLGRTKPAWLDIVYNADKQPIGFELNVLANVVCNIFRWTLEGNGRETIARMLNEAGVPSFKDRTWGGSSVAQIVKSPTVIGIYQPCSGKGKERKPVGEPVKGFYEPVIDEDTFYAANDAMEQRFKGRVTKQSARFNLWQQIAKCAVCGAALHTATKGKDFTKQGGKDERRTYFQCREARKGKCKGKAVRLDRSEAVFRELLAKVNSLSLVQSNAHAIQAELQAVDGRISEKEANIAANVEFLRVRPSAAIRNLVADDSDELTQLQAKKAELERALATDTIEDKNAFFAKLDLTSKEGRARANGLLKRLKILVFLDPARHHYAVEQDGNIIFDILHLPEQEPSFYPAGSVAHRGLIQRQEGTFTPSLRSNSDNDHDVELESEGHDVRDGY